MELHTSHSYAGRQVYNWIEKMAKLREEDDRVNPNKVHLQNTIKQMSKQHLCAVRLQRVYKRKVAAREALRAGASTNSAPSPLPDYVCAILRKINSLSLAVTVL